MTKLMTFAAAALTVAALGACQTSGGETAGSTADDDRGYGGLGTRGVTPEQARWLSSSHARPAGR